MSDALPELAGEVIPAELTQIVYDPELGALHLYSQPRTATYQLVDIDGVLTPFPLEGGGHRSRQDEDFFITNEEAIRLGELWLREYRRRFH